MIVFSVTVVECCGINVINVINVMSGQGGACDCIQRYSSGVVFSVTVVECCGIDCG